MDLRFRSAALLGVGLAAAALAAPTQAPEVRWRTDLAAARAEAKARNLPLFVVFRCER